MIGRLGGRDLAIGQLALTLDTQANMCVTSSPCIPVNDPGSEVVWDVSGVCGPVPVRQLLDLQGEVPQGGGA